MSDIRRDYPVSVCPDIRVMPTYARSKSFNKALSSKGSCSTISSDIRAGYSCLMYRWPFLSPFSIIYISLLLCLSICLSQHKYVYSFSSSFPLHIYVLFGTPLSPSLTIFLTHSLTISLSLFLPPCSLCISLIKALSRKGSCSTISTQLYISLSFTVCLTLSLYISLFFFSVSFITLSISI